MRNFDNMKFYYTLFLGLILFVSCNSKKIEIEQVLNNKWSSLKQYDLDSNIKTINSYQTYTVDNDKFELYQNFFFDKNGLLNKIFGYSLKSGKLDYMEISLYKYKFSENGDLLQIVCSSSENGDTTEYSTTYKNDIVYGSDFIIVKSYQHPCKNEKITLDDGTTDYMQGVQDLSKYETIEYEATIMSDFKIRFGKFDHCGYDFISTSYSLDYINNDSLKIEYYK